MERSEGYVRVMRTKEEVLAKTRTEIRHKCDYMRDTCPSKGFTEGEKNSFEVFANTNNVELYFFS